MNDTPNKYYYLTVIEECVLCGREKKWKHRVPNKPQSSTVYKPFACGEHFI